MVSQCDLVAVPNEAEAGGMAGPNRQSLAIDIAGVLSLIASAGSRLSAAKTCSTHHQPIKLM